MTRSGGPKLLLLHLLSLPALLRGLLRGRLLFCRLVSPLLLPLLLRGHAGGLALRRGRSFLTGRTLLIVFRRIQRFQQLLHGAVLHALLLGHLKIFLSGGYSILQPAWRSAPQCSVPRFNFSDGFGRCFLVPTAPDRLHLPESSGDIRGFPPRGTNRALNRARACAGSNRHF